MWDRELLTQLVTEPAREAPLDLLFVKGEGLVGDRRVGGGLGLGDHEMRVFDCQRRKERKKVYL